MEMQIQKKMLAVCALALLTTTVPSYAKLMTGAESTPESGTVVTLQKKDIQKQFPLIQKMLRQREFQNALLTSEQIIALDPTNIKAHAAHAAALAGLGKLEEFTKESAQLKQKAPDNPYVYLYPALALQAASAPEKAEKWFIEGINQTKGNDQLLMGLASFYFSQKQLNKAVERYEQILESNNPGAQNFLNANFGLCRIDLEQKMYDSVIKRTKNLIELFPVLPQAYRFQAEAWLKKDEPQKAAEAYKMLLQANPKIVLPYEQLTLLYLNQLSDRKTARIYAEEAVKKFPNDGKAQDILGWFYYKTGRLDKAQKYFTAATDIAPQNPIFHYHLGLSLLKSGKKTAAKKSFQQALALFKTDQQPNFARELQSRVDECTM